MSYLLWVKPTLLRKRSSKINPNLLAADISDELVCEIRKLKTTLTEKETRIQELERDREDEAVCFRLKQTESQGIYHLYIEVCYREHALELAFRPHS